MSTMEITITHIFWEDNQAPDVAKQGESNVWIGHWPPFIDNFLYTSLNTDYLCVHHGI